MKTSKLRWTLGSILLGGALFFEIGSVTAVAKGDWSKHEGRLAYEQDEIYSSECGACHLAYPPGLLPAQSWRSIMSQLDDHFGENAEVDKETSAHITNYISRNRVKYKKLGLAKKRGKYTCNKSTQNYPPLVDQKPLDEWGDVALKLEGHIDEHGKLDSEGVNIMTAYLDQPIRSVKKQRSSGVSSKRFCEFPVRITELPYFIHKHDEIPKSMVTGNQKVGSFSQCDSCHKDAERGLFDEDSVYIPGFGRWHD